MTKQEYKMILKLIDNHTITREVGYYCTEEKYMDEKHIKQLKQDLKDIFEGEVK